jgi:hypothetical protein
VHHSARHDRQQPMMMGATGPEFEVCDGDVFGL